MYFLFVGIITLYFGYIYIAYEFDKNANSSNVGMCVCTHFTFVSLATIGVCVFCAVTSVAALFILWVNSMKIIALCGKGQTGKSQTINLLVEYFKINKAEVLFAERAGKEKYDRRFVMKYNEKIFGITTRGDDEPSLKEDFAWFKKRSEIDCIICATRSKGKTCDFVARQANDIYWLGKTAFWDGCIDNRNCSDVVKEQQKVLNCQQAAELANIINCFIF